MSRKVAAVYDTVVERTPRKRYSAAEIKGCFLVKPLDGPSPIVLARQPHNNGKPFEATDDLGLSVQLRLNGYALAPLQWYRERGIDPVAMRDEDREYRETFFSVARRLFRRWPEVLWRLKHPTGKRAVDVVRF